MSYGIQLVAPGGRVNTLDSLSGQPQPGDWLLSYDPEYGGGVGLAGWTPDPSKAMHFEGAIAAMECWRTQSATVPFREDGKPNRPLTAYTVSIEKLEEV